MPCAHESCGCLAGADRFCGVECRVAVEELVPGDPVDDARSVPLMDCGCGHAACVAAQGLSAEL